MANLSCEVLDIGRKFLDAESLRCEVLDISTLHDKSLAHGVESLSLGTDGIKYATSTGQCRTLSVDRTVGDERLVTQYLLAWSKQGGASGLSGIVRGITRHSHLVLGVYWGIVALGFARAWRGVGDLVPQTLS